MSKPSSTTPMVATVVFIFAGLIIAALGGISSGSIAGGIVAGLGVIPACWGAWTGIQQESQGPLAMAILLALASLGVGGLLIILKVVDWVR